MMTRKTRAIALLAPVLLLAAGYALLPAQWVAPWLLEANRAAMGFERTTFDTSAGPVQALVAGSGPPVLFVHGVYGRKEHWVDMARRMTDHYRVVLIDLPGFGENPPLPEGGYQLDKQAARLAEIIADLGLGPVHLAANSMGAPIAALLAEQQPEAVASLALIGGPLGVGSPVASDMDRALQRGEYPLVVDSAEAFEARNAWLFPTEPFIPGPVLAYWTAAEVEQAALNRRIWAESQDLSHLPAIAPLLQQMDRPLFVYWCERDRIFNASGAAQFQNRHQTVVMTPADCGHLPMLDHSAAVAAAYLGFLSD